MPASVVRRVTMPDEGIESLFGSLDENLRSLEAALRVTIKTSGHDLMLEGDQGELTYQGTRYHGFARQLPSGALAGRKNKTQPSAPLSGACCVRCDTPLHAGSNQCPACNWTQPA